MILCINICQRPDWVIVLWTKIAPENNSIWFFESQKKVAPGRSSNDSSNHLISQGVTTLHVLGDSTLLWGLFNTEMLCCKWGTIQYWSIPFLAYSSPPPLLLNGSSAEYPLPLPLPRPGRCLPANQPNCCLSWTSLHNIMIQTNAKMPNDHLPSRANFESLRPTPTRVNFHVYHLCIFFSPCPHGTDINANKNKTKRSIYKS